MQWLLTKAVKFMSGFLQREKYLTWGEREAKLKMPLNIANKILPLFTGELVFSVPAYE